MKPSRADFGHPYQPYDIQCEFMIKLYDCLEVGNVAVFESPTGTGKSLSLICASLTWLRDRKQVELDTSPDQDDRGDDPEWMIEAERRERKAVILQQRQELEASLSAARKAEIKAAGLDLYQKRHEKRSRTDPGGTRTQEAIGDDDFMLEDYESEAESESTKKRQTNEGRFSTITTNLLEKLRGGAAEETEKVTEETRLIFCSRTHSQLTQFVNELRRVKPPPAPVLGGESAYGESGIAESVKHLSLGSRKNLCVNPQVNRRQTAVAINERCLELQRPGTAEDKKCNFFPSKNDPVVFQKFHDNALSRIRDIEDLADLGTKLKICPYYASRAVISTSEIVTLPYPLLLQKSAREALGLSVKNHVVIIDEAHNLMDAIANTYSVSMTLYQVELAMNQVTAYTQRFKNRLKGKNRVYVTQVIRMLTSIADCLKLTPKVNFASDLTVSASQLMAGKGVDQIRPHKLSRYIQESKLAYKVERYIQSSSDRLLDQETNAMTIFQSFLLVLLNPAEEGRFFISHDGQNVSVRYTLLDPREHFRDVVEEARAVILAGGTMAPMSDYTDYLFSYVPRERIKTFSFGHVIPPHNLSVQTIAEGPTSINFDFTYSNRHSTTLILELGQLILRLSRTIPDGLVVFLPSYDYLAQVLALWRQPQPGIFSALEQTKPIFAESKSSTNSTSTESLLQSYAKAIDTGHGRGAILLAVVGGKLSEGINFSDALGRCVVAVGLPFPNAQSAEWQAKIEHAENVRCKQLITSGTASGIDAKAQAKATGRELYENACMRAVNQCIGRAIRHKADYAAIVLVDQRYRGEKIRRKLSGWIQESMGEGGGKKKSIKEVEEELGAFFRQHQKRE